MNFTTTIISRAVQGEVLAENEVTVTGVEFDSRKIQAGDLFVPLKGTNDGHEFVSKAIENGAKATLWSNDPATAPVGIAVILVKDTLLAFQALASYYLLEENPDVIAITGSNGKTTTKDMTESVLSQKFRTYKTQGNYNNDIGLPYTILHMPEGTEKLILEMGMDHAGEISILSELAEPDVAAITIIGEAHIENLGSREKIADAKMEITTGLASDGLLIIPADEPLLEERTNSVSQTVETFGIQKGDLSATILNEDKGATVFSVDDNGYQIPLPGSYNVENALIAMAIGRWFDVSTEEIFQGLAYVQVTQNRTQWLKASNGADILSDVYNANPTAMGLVLDTFAKLPTEGRRLAVLADMLELGADSYSLHASMAEHINNKDFQEIYLYGDEMKGLKLALADRYPTLAVHYFTKNDKAQMMQMLKESLQTTDSVVLKGSNGMGLIEVVEALQK
ncbi:UDP-N-acetylmuramoyl-tripeptide--D-alanyl-D-alanine ligase [Enterococcus hulanensis]|uniref:UDP-N-acetylmuramoyl-tripeptide--D-alanyl-D-alanine ligase n=1 Tax=Enterococcus hulanensis TaxID=2559929 RepID=A0ABU3F0T0_9ENTE|nr:UDP-N-acetylmuramoyl-tripeptide--D-alanyl-D-alanine ligase [Enterococcus hulanensis]MDT2600743.1 UDP-N-acetylmuramoyl-tripeptide--D-alanyl-D-alanine ligase [Enterococcus hulanensis]MDT2610266.1 UDP-N-acetylmuramoyl-tripeptide--D-alanyl-D-alanine ligase [Enterococcus hulanensis]MDT2617326.1 UDP-N-acetylmuramoyl-tripeptide--D-alanyl-D-alanine ligase [Enterococcus hulanensis]MDT2628211.1 UDP-N-acetylmuramoyl-tripeptide--D-alanyl-D-alanine ligase [Enterococcus hulanensis]MDT2655316.1 UDP-N-acet